MEHSQLLNFIIMHGKISLVEEEMIRVLFKPSTMNKKEELIKSGCTCDKLFFIKTGLLRAFYRDENGKEVTRMIAWENRFLTNINSFKNFSDNYETIECIEKGEMLSITRENFEILMKSSLNLKSIYTDILEEYTALNILRFQHLHTNNLRLKLNHLRNDFPHLINRVNDNILSSFLAISRETFARNKFYLTKN